MKTDRKIKQGSLLDPVSGVSLKSDRTPAPIPDGSTVRFRMRPAFSDAWTIDSPAAITDGPNGRVSYTWQAGDTDVAGTYWAEFYFSTPGGPVKLPAFRNLIIEVFPSPA